jgi:hypothetical protein
MGDPIRSKPSSKEVEFEMNRQKIAELLKRGTSLKLLSGSGEDSRKYLQEAYGIAHREETKSEEPSVWQALTAYRLAHILMRSPLNEEQLETVDAYLREASRKKSLGPLPGIYRLAVMHRLKASKKLIENVIRDTTELLMSHSSPYGKSEADFSGPGIQDAMFNMLELAVYFSGQDYRQLEGLGNYHGGLLQDMDPFSDLYPYYCPWVLQGNDRKISEIRYPKRLVLEELEERAGSETYNLLFCLNEAGNISQWRSANDKDWKDIEPIYLRYLVATLADCQNKEEFNMISSDDRNEYINAQTMSQRKKRLLDRLIPHLRNQKDFQISRDDFFSSDRSSHGVPFLNPKIKVLGAIEASIINI